MKIISDGGRIINIHRVKFSRSEDYPRKTRKLIPLEISYPYGIQSVWSCFRDECRFFDANARTLTSCALKNLIFTRDDPYLMWSI